MSDGWQSRVASLLRDGFGVEDIAIRMKCSTADVRREVEILRNEGRLRDVLGLKGAKHERASL